MNLSENVIKTNLISLKLVLKLVRSSNLNYELKLIPRADKELHLSFPTVSEKIKHAS